VGGLSWETTQGKGTWEWSIRIDIESPFSFFALQLAWNPTLRNGGKYLTVL